MRRFRRFRRFRRAPLVKAQRPTWRQMFDFAISGEGAGRTSGFDFASQLGNDNFPHVDILGGAEQYVLFGPTTGAAAAATTMVGRSDLDFFEGEMTVVRMMGELRLIHLFTTDFSSGDEHRLIEIRAWMYKTWEQDINNRTGLVHPFNVDDYDARILWSAKWYRILQQQPSSIMLMNSQHEDFTSSANNQIGLPVQAYSDNTAVRRFSIKQPIKLKGNERIGLVFAAGPFANAGMRMLVQGQGRMLVKH